MKWFVLYLPSTGKYVSDLSYNRKTKQYDLQLTNNFGEIKLWNSRSSAEAQAQRIFACDRNVALEVKEIR